MSPQLGKGRTLTQPHTSRTPRLACAPFGGPIATVRDERAMVAVRGPGPTRPVVRLFSGSGAEGGSFLWQRGRLAGWGWSDALELVMVEPSGKVSSLLCSL